MTIRVQVTGGVNQGKTTVTAIIADALRAHGFDDVYVLCEEGDVSAKGLMIQNGHLPTDAVKQQLVVIDDFNGKNAVRPDRLVDGVLHYSQAYAEGVRKLGVVPPAIEKALANAAARETDRPVQLNIQGGSVADRALLAAAVRYSTSVPVSVQLTRGLGHDAWTDAVARYGRLRGAREPLPFETITLNVDLSES